MIWFNGNVLESETPVFKGRDRGILLGDGVFETMLSIGMHICFFDSHMRRLRNAADFLGIRIDFSNEDIATGAVHLVEDGLKAQMSSAGSTPSRDGGALRVTLTRGTGPRGLLPPETGAQCPSLMISWATLKALPGSPTGISAPASTPPLKAIISALTRNEKNPTSSLKALGYLDNQLAKREAKSKGAEEAVMLNSQGDVACSTVGNVFIITADGALVTPAVESGILPGITRQTILEIAVSCDLTPCEARLSPKRLFDSFVFITNSLIGLRRIIFDTETALGHENQAQHSFEMLCRAYEKKILAVIGW